MTKKPAIEHPFFLTRSIRKAKKEVRKFSPLTTGDHILTLTCPACSVQFQVGDETALVPMGPGTNEEARARAREGRPFNAIALPVHWACATGEESTSTD